MIHLVFPLTFVTEFGFWTIYVHKYYVLHSTVL